METNGYRVTTEFRNNREKVLRDTLIVAKTEMEAATIARDDIQRQLIERGDLNTKFMIIGVKEVAAQ